MPTRHLTAWGAISFALLAAVGVGLLLHPSEGRFVGSDLVAEGS